MTKIFLQVCGPDEAQHAVDILPKMLQVTGDAYDRTQRCYTENDLHGLPQLAVQLSAPGVLCIVNGSFGMTFCDFRMLGA